MALDRVDNVFLEFFLFMIEFGLNFFSTVEFEVNFRNGIYFLYAPLRVMVEVNMEKL